MDVFDLFGVKEKEGEQLTPELAEALKLLRAAVKGLSVASQGYRKAPDLSGVALAVQEVMEATGHAPEAAAVYDWFVYESSGRRATKIEEARARADAAYRADLEAIAGGWEPIYLVDADQTVLPWRQSSPSK